MDQTVVVFFDPYNDTIKRLAQLVAVTLHCETIEIVPEVPYSKPDLSIINPFSRIRVEIRKNLEVSFKNDSHDFSRYDFVCFCFPLWNHTVPTIVSKYANAHNIPAKHQMMWCWGLSNGFRKNDSPTTTFVITDWKSNLIHSDVIKGFTKMKESIIQHDPLSKHKSIHGLTYLGAYTKSKYPSQMPEGDARDTELIDGHAFRCFSKDNIDYIMLTTREGNPNYISAYDWNQTKAKRVGIAHYYLIQQTGDIYLNGFRVTKEYRNRGIGGNILKSIILSEQQTLTSGKNLFVHPSTSIERFENQLTQAELEAMYLKYGFTLVSCEGDICYEETRVNPESRAIVKKWLEAINTDSV